MADRDSSSTLLKPKSFVRRAGVAPIRVVSEESQVKLS